MTVRTLAQSAGVDLIEKLLALPYCEQATWFFPLAPQPLWEETPRVTITQAQLTRYVYRILVRGFDKTPL